MHDFVDQTLAALLLLAEFLDHDEIDAGADRVANYAAGLRQRRDVEAALVVAPDRPADRNPPSAADVDGKQAADEAGVVEFRRLQQSADANAPGLEALDELEHGHTVAAIGPVNRRGEGRVFGFAGHARQTTTIYRQ